MRKKCLAIAKKAMVWALAASMLVATPLTASAAGLRGVYSVSDGTDKDGNDSGTGTVTNTGTSSNTNVIHENDAKIIGIVLDKDYVNAEKDKKETLKATLVIEGDLVGKDGAQIDSEKQAEIHKELESKIEWKVLNADGTIDGETSKTLSISASADDRTVVTLNPRRGTKTGEEMIVRATIDSSYSYYWDEEGKLQKDEYQDPDKDMAGYTAEAKVYIKEYSEQLFFKNVELEGKAILKHTIDLNDYIERFHPTANDTITWISTNTKAATVTAAGVVTFKRADVAGSIIAVGEKGANAEWEFTVEAGTPASKVEIVDSDGNAFAKNATTVDLNHKLTKDNWATDDKAVDVVMYAKVKAAVNDNGDIVTKKTDAAMNGDKFKFKNVEIVNGTSYVEVSKDNKSAEEKELNITDTITWSSSKAAIASVESKSDTAATVTAKSVGTANITAKASSGKSAKLKVTVKATLSKLTITNKESKLYTGQSLQMTYTADPKASKDAVAWSVVSVVDGNDVKNPNATINSKGVLVIKNKLNDDPAYKNLVVVLKSKKQVVTAQNEDGDVKKFVETRKTITIEQSSVDGIRVTDDTTKLIAEVHLEKGKVKTNTDLLDKKNDNVTTINVPKSRKYTVDVTATTGYPGDVSTLTWKTSNAKVADFTVNGNKLQIEAKSKGTATMTVSGIRVASNKASVIKTTFKVNVTQPVKTVTLNKTSVVLNQKTKKVQGQDVTQPQKVALKATLGPKGVNTKEKISWSVEKVQGIADGTKEPSDKKGVAITSASVSVELKEPKIGDVYKITAKTASGASATATVEIVEKTTSVAIAQKPLEEGKELELFTTTSKAGKPVPNTWNAKIGDEFEMHPYINISAAKGGLDYHAAGTDSCETVEYSVSKKGIVTIDSDGTVHVINSGTVTITAKTPLGKKATLKVTVAKP